MGAEDIQITNPVRHLRDAAGLTQYQLANLAFTTEQYILRAEKGMVGTATDLSNILDTLKHTIDTRHNLEDRISYAKTIGELHTSYLIVANALTYPSILNCDTDNINAKGLIADWYLLMRALVAAKLGPAKRECLSRNYSEFKELRVALCHKLKLEPTLYSFCAVLGLHPYVVQRFEKLHPERGEMPPGIAAYWPEDIRLAWTQIGVEWQGISFGNQKAFDRGVPFVPLQPEALLAVLGLGT